MPCLACIWKIWPLRLLISLSACLEWLMHADWKWLVVRFLIFCWICSHRGTKHISYHAVFRPGAVKPQCGIECQLTVQFDATHQHSESLMLNLSIVTQSWGFRVMVLVTQHCGLYSSNTLGLLLISLVLSSPVSFLSSISFSFHFLWLACS